MVATRGLKGKAQPLRATADAIRVLSVLTAVPVAVAGAFPASSAGEESGAKAGVAKADVAKADVEKAGVRPGSGAGTASEGSKTGAGGRDAAGPGDARDQEESKRLIADIKASLGGIRSLWCEFRQVRRLKLFEEPLESRGAIMFERPRSIRWETTSPYRSCIVSNGGTPAQFEWRDGRRVRLDSPFPRPMGKVLDQIAAMHRGDFEALGREYEITAARRDGGVSLTMIPRDPGAGRVFSSLEIRMPADLSEVREVVLSEPGGDSTTISFEGGRRDVTFPDGTFDTRDPADIETVRAAAASGKCGDADRR
ncbi:MAG: outer membrane lipoprotein carrier protein LolA [Planctomycetota bacterium]|nr:outer membrane lipoprotein carrier protein LolA [Planctomycetota bacterium]